MVNGVCIQYDQLQRPGQLEDPFDFTLDLGYKETTTYSRTDMNKKEWEANYKTFTVSTPTRRAHH